MRRRSSSPLSVAPSFALAAHGAAHQAALRCRVRQRGVAEISATRGGRVPQRPRRIRHHRRPERDGRIPLAGGQLRCLPALVADLVRGKVSVITNARQHAGASRQSGNSDDPDRLRCRRRPPSGLVLSLASPGLAATRPASIFSPGSGGQATAAPALHAAQAVRIAVCQSG